MKAYRITFDRQFSDKVDAACEYQLPQLECRLCTPEWRGWGLSAVSYPGFQFSFLNGKEFNSDRYVTLDEFKEIRSRIWNAAGRRLVIVPGAGIGELQGTASSTRLEDFTWSRVGVPDISEKARDVLAEEGIDMLCAECSFRFRGKRLQTRLAVQVEPVQMLTKESLDRHRIRYCPRCEQFIEPPRPAPVVREGYMFKRSEWPEGRHLVQVLETCQVLASDAFIMSVKKHGLTGIVFEECGQFI